MLLCDDVNVWGRHSVVKKTKRLRWFYILFKIPQSNEGIVWGLLVLWASYFLIHFESVMFLKGVSDNISHLTNWRWHDFPASSVKMTAILSCLCFPPRCCWLVTLNLLQHESKKCCFQEDLQGQVGEWRVSDDTTSPTHLPTFNNCRSPQQNQITLRNIKNTENQEHILSSHLSCCSYM